MTCFYHSDECLNSWTGHFFVSWIAINHSKKIMYHGVARVFSLVFKQPSFNLFSVTHKHIFYFNLPILKNRKKNIHRYLRISDPKSSRNSTFLWAKRTFCSGSVSLQRNWSIIEIILSSFKGFCCRPMSISWRYSRGFSCKYTKHDAFKTSVPQHIIF